MESRLGAKCIPSDRISKKICFIMNNITETNLKRQVDEVTSIVPHHLTRWLAESLLRRVASEPNLHELYAEFVTLIAAHYSNFETFTLELLTKEIDRILKLPVIDPFHGKTLKHLGAFLGRLTIARDIPLCVDIKSLIYTAFKNKPDSLDYIIPFISQILKNTKYSYSIKPSDPWVKEILQVVKELHHITNKLPIQFEVELLFTSLECNMNELNSAFYLRRAK
ncbi:CCR4-NOT transcription complex subunit [Fasciola gigantica]|uniref:CCR4-NOT transcription complex subunit n=1 Tax=Fasciola gigantica TaxID=46835 RepID=A0A504YC66_FASGI|nr:CCR4-NOT transcription complex subunit [Fasciola gigantica]